MGEILVGLLIVVIAYVAYAFLASSWEGVRSPAEDAVSLPSAALHTEPEAYAERTPQALAPSAQTREMARPTRLRDPKTGDVAAVPNHYRFAKKWIKEAMVSEGLLDQVYRNPDLADAGVDEKVRVALSRFLELRHYHA